MEYWFNEKGFFLLFSFFITVIIFLSKPKGTWRAVLLKTEQFIFFLE